MLYSPAILAVMFGYQAPNVDTAPRYRAVGDARDAFEAALQAAMSELELQEREGPPDLLVIHRAVGDASLAYASAINEVAPIGNHVRHLSAQAVDAIVFARMWANKAIRAPAGPVRGRLVSLAKTESEKAQLCANAAIALDAPVAEAYSSGGP